MFHRTQLAAGAIAALVCGATLAASALAPEKFLKSAVEDGRAEVQAANLALQKSSDADVKSFAQQMVTDHSAADTKIESLAQGKNITLPDGVSVAAKTEYTYLDKGPASHFDKAYVDHMVTDHKKAVKMFTAEANSGTDPDVKSFAAETLPTLQKHLQMAEDLQATLKGNPAPAGSAQ